MKSIESDKTMFFRKLLSCVVVTAVLFLGVYLWDTQISRPTTSAATSKNISATFPEKPKYKHTRIADIKVGERVVTSSDDTYKPTAVDPATWKKVTLYAEETWYDGTVDSINVVTLVPPEWLALCDAKVGSMVPIPLDLQEMGLDENLLAKIQAIEECPEIRAGPGRVVLTTVNHLSRGICSLTYTTQEGQSETIRPTSSHRFYSLDRNEWIHIGDARIGEKLQGLGNGIIEVVSCQPLGTTERVYNMTVEDEHVYHVGLQNLLAHNTGCLTFDGRDSWVSKEGLIYGPDKSKSIFNNRVQHVFDHLNPNPQKPLHTVFSVDKKDLIPLLDEAWKNPLKQQVPGDPGAYISPMGRVIGESGEKNIRIVVKPGTLEIITAYPVL
jgi:hypothetical protein